MSGERVFVMGASGRVGAGVARALAQAGVPFRVGLRTPQKWTESSGEAARFDLADPLTYTAMQGCTRLFLMWPPGTTTAQVKALLVSARAQGLRQVAFLSVLGAEKVPVLPHRQIERLLERSGLEWVFLRASYFMQNLSTTHREDIRVRHEIFLPAGRGRTSMVDADDVAEVAALALRAGHTNVAYDLTGPAAPSYFEVAALLGEELGRTVRYTDILQFIF
jgi:uncharacterized protein YbjT (DUF2867 family)